MSASVPGTMGASGEGPRKVNGQGGRKGTGVSIRGVLCPSLVRAEDGLWS